MPKSSWFSSISRPPIKFTPGSYRGPSSLSASPGTSSLGRFMRGGLIGTAVGAGMLGLRALTRLRLAQGAAANARENAARALARNIAPAVVRPRPSTAVAYVARSNRLSGNAGTAAIESRGSAGVTITHREVCSLATSGSDHFHVTPYPINPGMNQLFPWLATLASRYEKYRFCSLSFSYKTTSSTASTGAILLGCEPDSTASVPLDLMQFMTLRVSTTDAPWKNNTIVIPPSCIEMSRLRDIRNGTLNGSYDIHEYDAGNLYFGTNEIANGTTDGILEVSYSVDLINPETNPGLGGSMTSTLGTSGAGIFGTNMSWPAGASSPLVATTPGTAYFSCNFEGLLAVCIVGTGINVGGITWNVTGATNSTFALLTSTANLSVNAAQTTLTAVYKVRVPFGAVVSPTLTATTVSSTMLSFAPIAIASLS